MKFNILSIQIFLHKCKALFDKLPFYALSNKFSRVIYTDPVFLPWHKGTEVLIQSQCSFQCSFLSTKSMTASYCSSNEKRGKYVLIVLLGFALFCLFTDFQLRDRPHRRRRRHSRRKCPGKRLPTFRQSP